MLTPTTFTPDESRVDSIEIYCKNTEQIVRVPVGATLEAIYEAAGRPLRYPPLGARVNKRVEGLTYRCWNPKDVEFVDYTHPSGYRIYLRSLCFILVKAVYDLYPSRPFSLEHPVSKGLYCAFEHREPMTEDDVRRIKQRMQEIIGEDRPFVRYVVRTEDALATFRERGMNDRALLIETAGMAYTTYYGLNGYIDYFYGCLTPSSGRIPLFDLIPYADGVLLQLPQREDPTQLYPLVPQQKMFNAYKQHLQLQRTVGVNYVGDLNRAVSEGHARDIIMVSEAMQEKQIAQIADDIARRYREDGVRIVLISGPSSSGKTTFCKRLQVQLVTNLLHPLGISLDDYYVNREDTPRDDDGAYDFESLYAIDLPYFHRDLERLLRGDEIELPSFDFSSGRRVFRGDLLQIRDNSVLILEGIHGLNPELTAHIPPERIYRIYVSALTTISLDGHNWIPTSDNRLLRRIVRDYHYRGYSARETIAMWPKVRRGDDRWVFPYQENADAMFNSAMIYELAALRRYAEPVLSEIRERDAESAEAYRLLRFLRYFNYIPIEELPATSLLREFLGGGVFRY